MSRAFLLILDGWGLGKVPASDAILQADTPFMDGLMQRFPHTTLVTHGEDVGLPEGQMGNSEVGHLNIGAGRIVWQELARINKEVRERQLHANPTLRAAFEQARTSGRAVHFIGLVSDGGVHSHIMHLKALCDMAAEQGVARSYIHAFTDGRDVDPKSGAGFIAELQGYLLNKPVEIASVIGRYYAMDRDKRWERVKLAYDLLVNGIGEHVVGNLQLAERKEHVPAVATLNEAILRSYDEGVTDEFLKPMVCVGADGEPLGTIQAGDVVIAFNFRTDRLRELTEVLTQSDLHEYNMHTLPLYYVTMTRYDADFRDVHVVYDKDDVVMTLGEVLERAGRTQVRIAETEKYPHVTFFFSGGREDPFEGERRILIPSPKVATYDLQPEMSAPGIRDAIMADIRANHPDFICLNFANTDMVGHTGVFAAAMQAAEIVDRCLSEIVPLAVDEGYALLIIADHGNSDYMINEDGTPNTAHTKNPVPCILVSAQLDGHEQLRAGRLADVAPTLLELMGIEKPEVMTGETLVRRVAVGS
jgi:2,3-bisphosphoglycerate-independent phosphoglycerate mutase